MADTIKGLYVPVVGKPEIRTIDNTPEAIQELVNGFFEMERVLPRVVSLINEDGIITAMPRNRHIRGRMYFGPVFFCRVSGAEMVDLLNDDIIKLQEQFLRDKIIEEAPDGES